MAVTRDLAQLLVVYSDPSTPTVPYTVQDLGCYTELALGEGSSDNIEYTCRNTGITQTVQGAITFSDASVTFLVDDLSKDGSDYLKTIYSVVGDVDVRFVLLHNVDKTSTITVDATGNITYPADRSAIEFAAKISTLFNYSSGQNDSGAPLTCTVPLLQSTQPSFIKRTA